MTGSGPVTLHADDGQHIRAELDAVGSLVISGQDLRPPVGWEEYEYFFPIAPPSLPLVRAALGGADNDPVLALLTNARERIVSQGVKAWLDQVGAPYAFWSRME